MKSFNSLTGKLAIASIFWSLSPCIGASSVLETRETTGTAKCARLISSILRSAYKRDLWDRKISAQVFNTGKVLFYPVVGAGKGMYFLYKGVRDFGSLPQVAQEAFKSFRADFRPFLGHLLIYVASAVSLTTYSELERATPLPKDFQAVIVVIDGYKPENPLSEEVQHHFVRQFNSESTYENAYLIERPDEASSWGMTEAFVRAWYISQKEGPLSLLEIHSDMTPGSVVVNTDPSGSRVFRELPYQMAELIISHEEQAKGGRFSTSQETSRVREAERLKRKKALEQTIRTELMAEGGQIVLYGCSVSFGESGEELHDAIAETFLQNGGRVTSPAVDLFLDYPNYYTGRYLGADLPSGNEPLNALTRYGLASAYLGVRVFRSVEALVSEDSPANLTMSCPIITDGQY